ncbi:hypothetical protein PPL_07363 [Heterostelium album PN500]|uniref:Uncharacterized protein n=1 Tax=Heterostelium pallidum (strain ATCC 26659 / Pp 5 / PN500) TaxID=670386 RepID=D3BFR2_HETP5|nr:hypothetical protein PPL_07363 [Heterostelium album PN500]EFA79672.1 hypothetical protein PPL_07363 [Heterostelium album PN500]|eukprot:XP_020431793.1 hypothetical protein PPL_07363 [Heterostelium album PN500]
MTTIRAINKVQYVLQAQLSGAVVLFKDLLPPKEFKNVLNICKVMSYKIQFKYTEYATFG